MPVSDPIEAKIASNLVAAILADGNTVNVWEGEDYAIKGTRDHTAIMDALASTDSDWIHVIQEGKRLGAIWLIYGNGEDLISDYSDNPAIQEYVDAAAPPPRWE